MEWGGFEHVLYTSGVTPDTSNKVPMTLTINQPKVGCPDGVCFFFLFIEAAIGKGLGCQLTDSCRDRRSERVRAR